MAAGYPEHGSKNLISVTVEMRRIGASNDGMVGNDAHKYGYHLSPNRLIGNGISGDYSLQGTINRVVDRQAACAIDIVNDWPASRKWIAWMFTEYAAGRLPHVVEIIGSLDGKVASYAAISTGRKRVRYTGTGHIGWTHVAHGRSFANQTTLGKELLGKWDANGLKPTPAAIQNGSDMGATQMSDGSPMLAMIGGNQQIHICSDVTASKQPFVPVGAPGGYLPGVGVCERAGQLFFAVRTGKKGAVSGPIYLVRLPDPSKPLAGVSEENLGGAGLGAPSVAETKDGGLVVTVTGTDHHIYERRFNGQVWTTFRKLDDTSL